MPDESKEQSRMNRAAPGARKAISRLGVACQIAAAVIAVAALISHLMLASQLAEIAVKSSENENAARNSWLRLLVAVGAGLALFWLGNYLKSKDKKSRAQNSFEGDARQGTWTQTVTEYQGGVWHSIVYREIVDDWQFRQARFVLEGGPTIIVTADQLRRIINQCTTEDTEGCRLRINPSAGAINDILLDWIIEH